MFRRAPQQGIISPAEVPAMLRIEPMRRRHVRSVIAIEDRIFTRPWSSALYLSELAQPSTRRYFVATVGNEVVGYIGCMLVVGEGHITTVGVAPEWHRRSIGTRLMLHLTSDVRSLGATSLTLEVRVSNAGAQELYRRFGFAPAGIRKNYYADVHEDAIVMWAHDVDTVAYGERLAQIAAELERGPRDRAPQLEDGFAEMDGTGRADAGDGGER
jgi:[ribosomal protein S18]-alanine N-acetyltransferase